MAKTKKARQPSDCQAFPSVGVTGFEPATTRPPDVYSNRTELRPDSARESIYLRFGTANI